jgi:hypothetical protein|tara:strand:- start:13323 stop:13511 length:189 start_codon:yes stop_codon:yes gene_type:complete
MESDSKVFDLGFNAGLLSKEQTRNSAGLLYLKKAIRAACLIEGLHAKTALRFNYSGSCEALK